MSTIHKAAAVLALAGFATAAAAAAQFQASTGHFTVPDGTLEGCQTLTTVPTTQRLVIEYVSADLTPPSTQRPWGQMLRTTVNGVTVYHVLQTEATGVGNHWLTTASLRLYADPGTSVDFCYHRSASTGTMNVLASLSGLLVDVAP